MDALAFEAVVIGDVELAVAGAGGDDDGARADRVATVQRDAERRRAAIDRLCSACNRQPGAELLCLGLRAAGQRLARDAGGKAQVVLDLRRGAGLAAGRDAFQHHGLQPFRRRVHRRRQACRAGADHRHVVHQRGVQRLGQPQRVGQRHVAGVAQHAVARRRDDHRQVAGLQVEAVEEAAGIGVGLGVQHAVRVAVARHEALQPLHVARMPGPNQHDAALRVLDEADAAQDEGAHDDLADVGLGGHQAAEVGPADAHHARRPGGAARDQDLAVVEEVHLAGELALAMHRDDAGRAMHVQVQDLDRSLQHQEEVDAALAAFEQQRAIGDVLGLAVGRHTIGEFGRQLREGLLLARIRVARVGRRRVGIASGIACWIACWLACWLARSSGLGGGFGGSRCRRIGWNLGHRGVSLAAGQKLRGCSADEGNARAVARLRGALRTAPVAGPAAGATYNRCPPAPVPRRRRRGPDPTFTAPGSTPCSAVLPARSPPLPC